jgi:hypothetical protein
MSAPRVDFFDICKIADASFWPLFRQELSRTAGGATQAKDLGSALWRASFTTAPARMADAAAIEAGLISLNGSAGSFLAHDMRRPYPRAHPGGFSGTVAISSLYAGDAFSLSLTTPEGGLSLSVGDYIGFQYGARPSYALHMVQETKTLSAPGAAAKFKVWPAIRPGALVGAAVAVNRAPCEMILEPGQQAPAIRDFVASALSFSAIQIL